MSFKDKDYPFPDKDYPFPRDKAEDTLFELVSDNIKKELSRLRPPLQLLLTDGLDGEIREGLREESKERLASGEITLSTVLLSTPLRADTIGINKN